MSRFLFILVSLAFIAVSCRQQNSNPAELPRTDDLYANIRYLDSLTHSREVDSVGRVYDNLTTSIELYAGQAPTPDDKAVLDSLQKIQATAGAYLRLCIDSRTNLEMLYQDTKSVETQFKSGQINAQTYASSLVGEEQVLVTLQQELDVQREKALSSLRVQDALIRLLTPLPQPGNP